MIKSKIFDGGGTGGSAHVMENGLVVSMLPFPPSVESKTVPYRQYFTDDGLSTGSNDMGVDGSSTNQEFWIPASTEADRYITSLSIEVAYGTSGEPNEWADGTALTNGVRFYYKESLQEIDIHDAIKNNQDFFRLSSDTIATSWEIRHLGATNDYGYILNVDFFRFGLTYGIKLDKGSSSKIIFSIRDNVGADADTFNVIAYGMDKK